MPETLTPPSPPSSAAPATPSPAPSATPSATPSPSTTPPSNNDDPFAAELETKFAKANADLSPNEPPKPAPKAPDAPATPPKPSAQPPKADKPEGNPELRASRDKLKAELETHQKRTSELETKIKDYESKGKDTEALMERLKARDAEFEKLQGELRALKQEASPEFKEKYDKPFDRAARFAQHTLEGIIKTDGAKADFDQDFVPLYRMPYNAAYARAREVFGDEAAPAVMEQVRELQKLDFQRREAFEEEKKGWAEKQKAEEGRQVQARQQWEDAQKKVREDLRNTVETYRDPVDDKELADLRKKGYDIFDREENNPRAQLFKAEHIRHRVAAFGPNQLKIKRLEAKNAELEERLLNNKGGQPNPDPRKPGGAETTTPQESWEDGARKAVKA